MKKLTLKILFFLVLPLSIINSGCKKEKTTKEDNKDGTEKPKQGFITFTVDGQKYSYPCAASPAKSSGRSQIICYSPEDQVDIVLTFEGAAAGSFNWGLGCGRGKAWVTYYPANSDEDYIDYYSKPPVPNQPTEIVVSSGVLNVTKFGAKGENVEGNFSATIYYQNGFETPKTKQITGSFIGENLG